MASTTATWTDKDAPPSLAAMSVNDDKTITGKWSTVTAWRYRIAQKEAGGFTGAKKFTLVSTGPKSIKITRTA